MSGKPEISGNLTAAREISGILLNVREVSEKSKCQESVREKMPKTVYC